MAALPSCRSCVKTFNVVLLDGRALQIQVGAKATYYDVFEKACLSIGLTGTQVFGLAFQSADEAYYFVDLSDVVSKRSTRLGRSLHLTDMGTMHMRVQYYVSCLGLLKDHTARHYYYLQLRENFLRYAYECTEERCFLMAAYALRADFGAYDAERHSRGYFEPSHYFPKWVIDKYGSAFIVKHMPSIHADLSHVRRDEAKHTYMLELCSDLPSSYNLHLYRLRRKRGEHEHEQQRSSCSVYLALSPNGLELFQPSREDFVTRISSYPWWSIDKVTYEKQKLKLTFAQASHYKKLELYAPSAEWCKHLLWLIRHMHQVQRGMQQQQEADDGMADSSASSLTVEFHALSDRKKYRESYIHSDVADLEWEHEQSLVGDLLRLSCAQQHTHPPTDNRVSVISNGSSNTTSGVVSDRLHISFDESDGEADQYSRTPGSKHLARDQVPCSARPCKDGHGCQPSRLMRKEPSADSVLESSQKVARYLSAAAEHRSSAFDADSDHAAGVDSYSTLAGTGKPVQRASSDPNKPQADPARCNGCGSSGNGGGHGSLCRQRRAVSDDELVMSSLSAHHHPQASEHIYENVTVFRCLPSPSPAGDRCLELRAGGSPTLAGTNLSSRGGPDQPAAAAVAAASRSDDFSLLARMAWPAAAAESSWMTRQVSDGCHIDLPPPPSYAAAQLQKHLRQLGSSPAAAAPAAPMMAADPAAAAALSGHACGTTTVTNRHDSTNRGNMSANMVLANRQQQQSSTLLQLLHKRQAGGMASRAASTSAELVQQPAAVWRSSCHGGQAHEQDMYASAGVLDANQNFAMSRSVGDCRQMCALHDHKKSHPDINKLRDMSHDMSLPLIAGLCNDKHLTASMEACTCAGLDDDESAGSMQLHCLPSANDYGWVNPRQKFRHHAADERPLSWHCGEAWSNLPHVLAAVAPAASRGRAQSSVTSSAAQCSIGSAPLPSARSNAVTRLMV